MANIVQVDDFTGEILIAQTSQEEVRDSVEYFIKKYEPKILTALLGIDLYNLLKAGIVFNNDGTINIDDTPVEWVNLIQTMGSCIANYIYFYYMRDNNTQTGGIGEAKANSDNASNASPIFKMVRAWNEMVEQVWQTVSFINNDQADYGAYYITNLFCYGYVNSYCNRPEIFDKINTMGL